MLVALVVVSALTLFFLARSVFMLFFSMENYNIHRKRLKQLRFNNKKQDMDASEFVDKVTKPVITYLFPRLTPKNLDQLAIDLRMAKWDNNFTPIQFRALSLILKVLGVVMFLLFYGSGSVLMGLLFGIPLCFGINFLFGNSIKNRKEKLIADFPDFIRITEGYLSANVPFSKAVSESIKYVGDEWKPILQNFVVECDVKSIDVALDNLKAEVDLFEVREFVALVKLTLEQGGDAKESFNAQADKIREMQLAMIATKIGKRQLMGTALQGPLLLMNLAIFGLPTIASFGSMMSM